MNQRGLSMIRIVLYLAAVPLALYAQFQIASGATLNEVTTTFALAIVCALIAAFNQKITRFAGASQLWKEGRRGDYALVPCLFGGCYASRSRSLHLPYLSFQRAIMWLRGLPTSAR